MAPYLLLLLLLEALLCVLQVVALGAVVHAGEEHGGLALARLLHVPPTQIEESVSAVPSSRLCSITWLVWPLSCPLRMVMHSPCAGWRCGAWAPP